MQGTSCKFEAQQLYNDYICFCVDKSNYASNCRYSYKQLRSDK